MRSGWCRGRNVTGYTYKILAVIITTAIFCSGCRTDTPGNNSTAVTEQAAEENTSAEDIKDQKNTGEPRQYVWGTWKVIAKWNPVATGWKREPGNTEWLMDSEWRILPDNLSATGRPKENSTDRYEWSGSVKLDRVCGSIVTTEYLKDSYGIRNLEAEYCLRLRLDVGEYTQRDLRGLFSLLYLTGKREMVGMYGGRAFLLEKTEDYDCTGTVIPESGIMCGEWEITDADWEKEQCLVIATGDLKPETFGEFCSAGTGDIPDGSFAEKAGFGYGDFSTVCEFTDGFGWDRIILKDRITAVLEKDGNFYLAKKAGEDREHSPADMDGWEYTGEKKLPVWGTWTVMGRCVGDELDTDCNEVGDTYQLLPDKCIYKSKTGTESVNLEGFYRNVVSPEWIAECYGPGGWEGNCILQIEPSIREVFSGDIPPFAFLYLEREDRMVGKIARNSYLLEKTGDYDGSDENAVFKGGSGMFNGVWEITEALGAYGDTLIGEYLSTEDLKIDETGMEISMKNWLVRDFYMADREDKSVRKLVDVMGIKDDPFLYIYEFKKEFFWDKMILKDENTVLLEKDGDFYWAERKGSVDYGI